MQCFAFSDKLRSSEWSQGWYLPLAKGVTQYESLKSLRRCWIVATKKWWSSIKEIKIKRVVMKICMQIFLWQNIDILRLQMMHHSCNKPKHRSHTSSEQYVQTWINNPLFGFRGWKCTDRPPQTQPTYLLLPPTCTGVPPKAPLTSPLLAFEPRLKKNHTWSPPDT